MNYYEIKEIHCPVDNFITKISKILLPKISNLDDSKIYCISLLFGILCSYTIKNKIKLLPGIFFFLSYLFNNLYNYYIYVYKKQTYINNYLFNLIIYLYILYILYERNYFAFITVFILMIPTICNWGCKIKYIRTNYPDTYDIPIFNDMCQIFCPFFKTTYQKYNIFGNGTLILIISIYLAFFL